MRNLKVRSDCPNIYTVTTGRVQSFKFPLTLPGEWLEYKIHGDIITQMKLSLDDNRLITASKDGSLCFWQVRLFNLTWFFFTLSIYFQLKILISIKLSTHMLVYHCHKPVLLGKWPLLQVCYKP